MTRRKKKDDWLEIGEEPRIEPAKKLKGETGRASTMGKKLLGKSRTWACDGEYVWLRRKQANPETIKRHEAFIASGEYKYVETQDDIEIFQLQEKSPFKRKQPMDLTTLDMYNVRRQACLAACRRDWVFYIDALEEIAGRLKGAYDSGMAKTMFMETLDAIENSIAIRGGPNKAERDREVAATRAKHGLSRDRKIYLPT